MLVPWNPAASAAVEPAGNTANPCIHVRRDIFPFSYASNSFEIVSFIEILLYGCPRRGWNLTIDSAFPTSYRLKRTADGEFENRAMVGEFRTEFRSAVQFGSDSVRIVKIDSCSLDSPGI